MFTIAKSDAGILTVKKKGIRGGSIRFDSEELDSVREWLSNPLDNMLGTSVQIFSDQNSLVLKGLDSTEMVVKIGKDVSALLELLLSVATYSVATYEEMPIEEPVEELTLPEGPSTIKVDPSLVGQLVETLIPLHIHVYRIAYLMCVNCNNELRLEHKDNYNSLALICPHCNQVVLLED